MKILYTISARGTNLNIKEGYYVHVKEIYKGLENLGHDVHLLAISGTDLKSEFPNSSVIKHRYMPLVHHFVPYTGLIDTVTMFFKIIRLYHKYKFDVIHNRWGLRNLGAHWASKFLGIPMLLEVNGPGIEEKAFFAKPYSTQEESYLNFIRKIQMTMCDHIFAVSNILKKIMLIWGIPDEKISVLPNAANPDMYKDVKPLQKIKKKLNWENKTVIAYTGTLHVWYGLEYLPNIFKNILMNTDKVRFLIVGNGQYKTEFQQQIKNLKIENFINFWGSVKHEQIPNVLYEVDIVVAPYRDLPMGFFGSALKIFEYMMAGKPIVTTNLGQNGEILENNKTALLVPPDDPDAMTNAILELINDPEKANYLGQNAQKIAYEKHTWKKYCKELESLYRQIIIYEK